MLAYSALCFILLLYSFPSNAMTDILGGVTDPSPRTVVAEPGKWRVRNNFIYINGQHGQRSASLITEVEYQIAPRISVQSEIPLIFDLSFQDFSASGLGDIELMGDFSVIKEQTFATALRLGMKLPTGDPQDNAFFVGTPLGFIGTGTFDFIMELENVFQNDDWYISQFIRAHFRTKHRRNRIGSEFPYEFEIARRISIGSDQDPSTLLYGFTYRGAYQRPDIFATQNIRNSGSNIIFFGPIFSWTKGSSILLFNVELPVVQNLFGPQPELNFRIQVACEISF